MRAREPLAGMHARLHDEHYEVQRAEADRVPAKLAAHAVTRALGDCEARTQPELDEHRHDRDHQQREALHRELQRDCGAVLMHGATRAPTHKVLRGRFERVLLQFDQQPERRTRDGERGADHEEHELAHVPVGLEGVAHDRKDIEGQHELPQHDPRLPEARDRDGEVCERQIRRAKLRPAYGVRTFGQLDVVGQPGRQHYPECISKEAERVPQPKERARADEAGRWLPQHRVDGRQHQDQEAAHRTHQPKHYDRMRLGVGRRRDDDVGRV